MSLDRFIFCPCTHTLEAHGKSGCTSCSCSLVVRQVIDCLLDLEREAIRRTWMGCGAVETGAEATLRVPAK